VQVILTLNAPLFDKVPAFKTMHPQLLHTLLLQLELEYYIANEYVIWQVQPHVLQQTFVCAWAVHLPAFLIASLDTE
jgi:hypothetical protein